MGETVILSRAECEALLDRIEEVEDMAALDRLEANIGKHGFETATADYLPLELVKRLSAGELNVFSHAAIGARATDSVSGLESAGNEINYAFSHSSPGRKFATCDSDQPRVVFEDFLFARKLLCRLTVRGDQWPEPGERADHVFG